MEIAATFIGKDSLGYENGKQYHLIILDDKRPTIMRKDKTGICPYESFKAFMENWTNITHPENLKPIKLIPTMTEEQRKEFVKHWNEHMKTSGNDFHIIPDCKTLWQGIQDLNEYKIDACDEVFVSKKEVRELLDNM